MRITVYVLQYPDIACFPTCNMTEAMHWAHPTGQLLSLDLAYQRSRLSALAGLDSTGRITRASHVCIGSLRI